MSLPALGDDRNDPSAVAAVLESASPLALSNRLAVAPVDAKDGKPSVPPRKLTLAEAQRQAQQILRTVAPVGGVARAFVDRLGEVPQSIINIDRDRAARYGLNVGDIQDVIETGLGGKAATELWEGEKHFSVVVRLSESKPRISALKDILVETPRGVHVPLAEVLFETVGVTASAVERSRPDHSVSPNPPIPELQNNFTYGLENSTRG